VPKSDSETFFAREPFKGQRRTAVPLRSRVLAGLGLAAVLLAAQEPVSVHEVSRKPAAVTRTGPDYSDEARAAGVWAAVVLRLVIGTDGIPSQIAVTRGAGFGLDEKAVEALSSWRFTPAEKDGAPVPVRAQVEINFKLIESPGLTARLNFENPAAGSRPVLISGRIPKPARRLAAPIEVRLEVSASGVVTSAALGTIGSIPPAPAADLESILAEVRSWKFQPRVALGGAPVPAVALLEMDNAPEPVNQ
jgi:TonB family protein